MTPNTIQPITDEQLSLLIVECRHGAEEHGGMGHDYDSVLFDRLADTLVQLRARLRAAEKDAERWRYARQLMHPLDIVDFQDARDSIGLPATENISLQVDAAIDAAMHQG